MSQENVEVVRRVNALWKSGDFSQLPELCDPEVVIDTSRNVFNPDVYRGYEGVRRVVEGTDEMWDSFEVEIEEVVDAGNDTIFAAARISGLGEAAGSRRRCGCSRW